MSAWLIRPETSALCIRDPVSGGDHRYCFANNQGIRVLGNYCVYPNDSYQLIQRFNNSNWIIEEVQGWLVFRTNDYSSIFIFFPSNGIMDVYAGNGNGPPCTVTETYFTGKRWHIAAEHGLLIFRDMLSGGDHRYAFGRNCGIPGMESLMSQATTFDVRQRIEAFQNLSEMNNNSAWKFEMNSNSTLFFKDQKNPGDNRFALSRDQQTRVTGRYQVFPTESYHLIASIGSWVIEELCGWLVIRTKDDASSVTIFFPSCGTESNIHASNPLPGSSEETYFIGKRWVIKCESGILVFRDIMSNGDHRHAFWPGCGNYNCVFAIPQSSLDLTQICNNYHFYPGKAWSFASKSEGLCVQDVATFGDHRYVFGLNAGIRVLGNYCVCNNDPHLVISVFGNWVLEEVKGWLVFRTANCSSTFIFFPASGVYNVAGDTPATTATEVYFTGHRWRVLSENGLLILRDVLSGGDHRFAFGKTNGTCVIANLMKECFLFV